MQEELWNITVTSK